MRKRILIGIGIFLLVMIAGAFWVFNKLNNITENRELSAQIPTTIQSIFEARDIDDYPFQAQEMDWENRFLIFDWEGHLVYNKQRNEALSTAQYFPEEKINGLVLVKTGSKHRGYYKKDETDPEISANEAYQQFYAFSYFDLEQRIVVARDTIWGKAPKKTKTKTADQHGILPTAGLPDEQELIHSIAEKLQ